MNDLADHIREFTKGSKNPADGFRAAYYTAKFLVDNPTYFNPDGIWVFCGPQGSGKTLSAVQCAQRMAREYPAARVISNLEFELGDGSLPEVFDDYAQLSDEDNGIEGLIFVLDEIHVLWNSLESRSIPISDMAALCQMRKSRRVIIGTSQVYGRIAKPIREQLKYVILCHNFLRFIQHNVVCDPVESVEVNGQIRPDVLCERWWFHSPELYASYETLKKIQRVSRSHGGEIYRG